MTPGVSNPRHGKQAGSARTLFSLHFVHVEAVEEELHLARGQWVAGPRAKGGACSKTLATKALLRTAGKWAIWAGTVKNLCPKFGQKLGVPAWASRAWRSAPKATLCAGRIRGSGCIDGGRAGQNRARQCSGRTLGQRGKRVVCCKAWHSVGVCCGPCC